MIVAARKLQGIGLIMLVTFFFLLAYPVHLSVSATRGELRAVERDIAAARARNRMIEGDIAVLANVRQLDRWNIDYFGYVAPTAEHYRSGERALANLEGLRAPQDRSVRAPVLAAMALSPGNTVGRSANDGNRGLPADDQTQQSRLARLARVSVSRVAMRDLTRTAGPRTGAPAGEE